MRLDRSKVGADGGEPLLRRLVAQGRPIFEGHRQAGAAIFRDRGERFAFLGRQRQEFVHQLDRRLAVDGQRLLVERVGLGDDRFRQGCFAAGLPGGLVGFLPFRQRSQHGRDDAIAGGRLFLVTVDASAEHRAKIMVQVRP